VLLSDTTQAVGRIRVDVSMDQIDFATISSHKMHALKGCGALVAGPQAIGMLDPLILGGGQERGMRGGTLDVPGIVGLGAASRIVLHEIEKDMSHMAAMRDRLEQGIRAQLPGTWVNGDANRRVCNTTNLGFRDVDARLLIREARDVAVSTRAACSSGASRPSHVLSAIGLNDQDAFSCVRFSVGRFTTVEEIDYAIDVVVTTVHAQRERKRLRA